MQEDNDKRINSILDELRKGTYAKGTIEQKLSDFYKLAMDQKRRNKEGVSPVMPIIKKMEAAQTKEQLFEIQKELMQYGDQQFMYMGFGADDKNATENILNIYQGGLTLGQKEYYLDDDEATAKIRAAYKNHIVTMFQLFGFKKGVAQQKMEQVLKIETALAKVSKNRTELRDVEANYNKMTLKEFEQKYPHVQLSQLAQAEGVDLKYIQDMIVGQPDFVAGADKVIAEKDEKIEELEEHIDDCRRIPRLYGVGRDYECRQLPERQGGGCQFRLLRQDDARPQGELPPVEARHRTGGESDG